MSDDYELMSYRQLQRSCKEHGLDANGSRTVLLERLASVKGTTRPRRRTSKGKAPEPVEEPEPADADQEPEEQEAEEQAEEEDEPKEEAEQDEEAEPDEEVDQEEEEEPELADELDDAAAEDLDDLDDDDEDRKEGDEVVGCIIRRRSGTAESKEQDEEFVLVSDEEVKQMYTEAFTRRLGELIDDEDEDDDAAASDIEDSTLLGSVLTRHTRKWGLSRSVCSALLVFELMVVFFALLLKGQMHPPPLVMLSDVTLEIPVPPSQATPASHSPSATVSPPELAKHDPSTLFETLGDHGVTLDPSKPQTPKKHLPSVEQSSAFVELINAACTQALSLSFWSHLLGYFLILITVPTAFGLVLGKYNTPQSVFAFALTRYALWYLLSPGIADDLLGTALPFKLFMVTTAVSLVTAFWDHCKP